MTDSTSNPTGDRDEAGRWLPGHKQPGPGRPRGLDFRRLIQENRGETYEQTIVQVYDMLVVKALQGDVQAIKLLFDRMCDKDADKLIIGRSLEEILGASWERNKEGES